MTVPRIYVSWIMDKNKKERSLVQSVELKISKYVRGCKKFDKIRNETRL